MNEQERILFNKLSQKRQNQSSVFKDEDFEGLMTSVAEKYSESAHFIYELLQNADDARATEVSIILYKDGLVFKHNGTVHFDVTDVDIKGGRKGHINSITAVANSTKKNDGNTIGKFGVGFKAVFQYTDAPEIYDDNFKFRIIDYIVPEEIINDHPLRDPSETLFYFPFKDSKNSYSDVKERLNSLDNPILFLSHINLFMWMEEGISKMHRYYKDIVKDYNELSRDTIDCKYILVNNDDIVRKLLLFEESIPLHDSYYPINVAYYLDASGKIDVSIPSRIFCYFPTRELFPDCHFICHAPFLLTDSRQNFKNHKDNDYLKRRIAKLVASSLPILRDIGIENNIYLINENIFDLVSLKKSKYIDWQWQEDLFYDEELKVLKVEPLLLCQDNQYRLFKDCYYCTPLSLYNLLKDEHLNQLNSVKNKYALVTNKIETTLANSQTVDIQDYCKQLQINKLAVNDFARLITADFMSQQQDEWVHRLYRFLHNEVQYSWRENGAFRTAPIIYTIKNQWVAPYQQDGTLNVFFPLEMETDEYNIVNPAYLFIETTKKFFIDLGLKEPSREDFIKSKLLTKYKGEDVDIDDQLLKKEFEIILSHYLGLDFMKKQEFAKALNDNSYLLCDGNYLYSPSKLYFVNEDTLAFFKYEKEPKFFSYNYYEDSVKKHGKEVIDEFLMKLGVNTMPVIKRVDEDNIDVWDVERRLRDKDKETGSTFVSLEDYSMEGLESYLSNVKEVPQNISRFIWKVLMSYDVNYYRNLSYYYKKWHARRISVTYDDSSLVVLLREKAWLFGKTPDKVSVDELEMAGFTNSPELFKLFGIYKRNDELKNAGVSDEQIELLDIIQDMIESGMSMVQIKQKLRTMRDDINNDNHPSNKNDEDEKNPPSEKGTKKPNNDKKRDKEKNKKDETQQLLEDHEDYSETWEREFDNLKNQENRKPKPAGSSSFSNKDEDDEDDKTDNSVFGTNSAPNKKTNSEKDKNEKNKVDAERNFTEAQNDLIKALSQQELRAKLDVTPQYTFKWFSLLFGLYKLNQPKDKKSKDLCISFYDFELSDDEGMLTIKNPTSQIPHWVEDSLNINLGIYNPKETAIDAKIVSVDTEAGEMFFDVRDQSNLKAILYKARKFVAICQSQNNIVDSLIQRFAQLDYPLEQNLKDTLPSDISFIYGPPGTGKTVEVIKQLANIVEQAVMNDEKMDILVLTPTNTAADEIIDKILYSSDNPDVDESIRKAADTCYNYAYRYGITGSKAYREEFGNVANRDTFNINASKQNILVTTIARFPYDYMQPDNIDLCDYSWDYIVFDEASMIDLIQIMYVLHKAKDSKFIVAGDPKQIPPVNTIGYEYGNIYTCVDIYNLELASKYYKKYPITALTTQYRSIPVIGNLISHFCYDGLVKPFRKMSDCKPFDIDNFVFKNINFLGFEIKDFNLLYSRNTVGQSSINIYSVLFTYEFVKYISNQLAKNHPNIKYTIGIASPYRAEADAIRQMFENYPVCQPIKCGTVHSFQGGQCDIMFVVMNPALSNSYDAHVNKDYILNVAMSRARDYLFIIAPIGEKDSLPILKRIKLIMDNNGIKYDEERCSSVEYRIFDEQNWIESNTTITSHADINTYSDIQSIYDIRLSDNALDIRKRART